MTSVPALSTFLHTDTRRVVGVHPLSVRTLLVPEAEATTGVAA